MSNEKIVMTEREYQKLLLAVRLNNERAREHGEEKAKAGAEQDGWHDEGFKHSMVMEAAQNQRSDELAAVLETADVVRPVEQKETVQLGNGAIISIDGGSKEKVLIIGYTLETPEYEVISYRSPVFAALQGAKAGERKSYQIGGEEHTIEVFEIILPSEADLWLLKP